PGCRACASAWATSSPWRSAPASASSRPRAWSARWPLNRSLSLAPAPSSPGRGATMQRPAMDGPLALLLVALVATLPAMLAHELARAAAALALTRGRVCVLLGAGRPVLTLRLGRLVLGATARWM